MRWSYLVACVHDGSCRKVCCSSILPLSLTSGSSLLIYYPLWLSQWPSLFPTRSPRALSYTTSLVRSTPARKSSSTALAASQLFLLASTTNSQTLAPITTLVFCVLATYFTYSHCSWELCCTSCSREHVCTSLSWDQYYTSLTSLLLWFSSCRVYVVFEASAQF